MLTPSKTVRECRIIAAVVCFVLATPALAQSPYVAAAAGADISRFDRSQTNGVSAMEVDDDAFAFALRAGTEIGQSWGVELEFVRPAMREVQRTQDSPLVGFPGFPVQGVQTSFTLSVGPAPQYQIHVRRRNTTFSTLAWISQDLADRLALIYMGGIAFHRFTQESTVEVFPSARLLAFLPPRSTKSVGYTTGPVAGVEARIRLTEHVRLVPGVRMHGVTGGWIVRPNVGVGWSF